MDRTVEIRMVTVNDMPDSVAGCCQLKNGRYLILINENKTAEEQAAAAAHEFLHIWYGDHNSDISTGKIETSRH